MGIIQVTVAVSNPGDPQRRWEGLFLVDTGAIDSMVPGNKLMEIGIKPEGKRTYELTDGTEVTLDTSVACFPQVGQKRPLHE